MPCSKRKVKPFTPNSLEERPSHFFKVILPTALAEKKLRIPEKFVKKFGDELSSVATLTVPNGRVWQVGLTKDGREIWFQDGWHDFIEYHSIRTGYFLVFRYEKKSTFQVLIFDITACEIHYPYNSEEPAEKNSVHQDKTKNKPQSNLENSKLEPQNKQCKMEEMKEINEPNHENAREFLAFLEEMGICFGRNYRLLSKEERQRAINFARLLKPEHPSFMVIIRSRNIHEKRLHVPSKFFNKYLTRDARFVTLQISDGGRNWPVQINSICNGGFRLTKGWTGFSRDKNLKEGDICVFELIRMKDFILKVSVYYAAIKLTC